MYRVTFTQNLICTIPFEVIRGRVHLSNRRKPPHLCILTAKTAQRQWELKGMEVQVMPPENAFFAHEHAKI